MDPEKLRLDLQYWLRQRLVGADEVELPQLQRPEAGGSSETLFLDPIIREYNSERRVHWVLRAQATQFQVYEDPSVERQYRVMQRLGELNAAPVPKMLWYEPDPAVIGTPFFVMERVEGRVPADLYNERGLFTEVTAAVREALWLSAIESLARIHSTNPDDFRFLERGGQGASGLDHEIAHWDSYMRWSGAPIRPIQERARRWLEDHLPAERPTGLAWGDARLGNMVFRDQRCVAVIDWETTSLGGAETDLGWWLFYDWMVSDGFGHARLPGIGDRDQMIRVWQEFAGRPPQALDWHEVFATWRYNLISDRARHLMRTAGSGKAPPPARSLPAERLAALIGAE
jgi:aminoglycoside phosphotransferase (APT) family kinase protein